MLNKDAVAMDMGGFIFNILIFMLLWVYGGDYRYGRGHSMEENDNKEVSHSQSNFSWAILSKGERCNKVNPM